MSSAVIETPITEDPMTGKGVAGPRPNSQQSASPWRWMILACVLLGLSGGWRAWRDYQFAKLNTESKDCPFSLSDLPKSLGAWQSIDDTDGKLDPEIARIAGATHQIIRTYVESGSGEKVQILLLYGLAQDVFAHTPEVCYPASGSQPASRPVDRDFNSENEPNVPSLPTATTFRTQIFLQRIPPSIDRYIEVYYAFRHGGQWKPDMAGEWKSFRYQPGMFKIQTSRQVSAGAANPNSPMSSVTKSLITEIVKDLEKRLASAKSAIKK